VKITKNKAIANFGEYSENIYDFAKANQWNKVDRRLNLLGARGEHIFMLETKGCPNRSDEDVSVAIVIPWI
jgi:hypothetical protein